MKQGKFSQPRTSADYIREGKAPPRRPPQKSGGRYASNNSRPAPRKRRRRRLNPRFILLCIIVLALLIAAIWGIAGLFSDKPDSGKPEDSKKPGATSTDAPTDLPTEPFEPVVGNAVLAATGDVLMHMPVVNSGYDSASGTYDFSDIFQYLDDYAAAADYAVANLETTLAGTDNGYVYSGYPCFNCPDEIADALKGAGFDMMLTANNHCYDTRTVGLTRTLQVAKEKGLHTLGTQENASASDWRIEDLNGIQVGMMCYSYATADSYPDRPSLNGILVGTEADGMVNYFDLDQLDAFYEDVRGCIAAMESDGAEAIVMYIHWGEEYQLSPNASQTEIAQKLCDLGVDVIVGGHPHVVQPVKLLTSNTDSSHRTVCLYSMGNAISNQQRQNMNLNTGHTEDGVLFSFGFTEYADGEVLLDTVDILPTWVYMEGSGNSRTYRILTLDDEVTDWSAAFGISASAAESARASYDRTMALVGTGLTESQNYLDQLREEKLASLTGPNT